MLWCSLRLPDLLDEERADLKERVHRWQDALKADRHFRKALAHREKGDLQGAIEELSATVRLDPASADAFRQRGALALRCGCGSASRWAAAASICT